MIILTSALFSFLINIKVYVSRLKIIHAIISEMGCDAVFSSSKSIVLYWLPDLTRELDLIVLYKESNTG
jgi:hypothetical protein